jgi:hypothetical protein
MPMSIITTTGGAAYADPFVGPVNHTAQIKIDVSTLTTAEVDAQGYLKPGVAFQKNGALVSASSGQFVYGVTVAPVRIVAPNPSNTTLGADTSDPFIAVATIAQINRDIAEDNLGRAYNANELTAFGAAGCLLSLTNT